jgi:hypothetical protein
MAAFARGPLPHLFMPHILVMSTVLLHSGSGWDQISDTRDVIIWNRLKVTFCVVPSCLYFNYCFVL